MIRYYVEHQLDVIVRRTTYRLRKANERAHILRGLVKALDALDEVIALILAAEIADLEDILAKPERQRAIVRDELKEIADKHGDDRRTRIIAADGDVADEDLIAREDVVVTITETGYAKRTKTDTRRDRPSHHLPVAQGQRTRAHLARFGDSP